MATIKIYDRANELRIKIIGRFGGDVVNEVARAWENALCETASRTLAVDITRLNGYDKAGCLLLREMYRHGVQFAAGTPLSLVFLNEISAPPRRGPALVQEASSKRRDKETGTAQPRSIAAGQ